MKSNRKVVYLVIVIALIAVMVALSTYAFFLNANNLETNVPLDVSTVGKSAFTASSEGDIVLDISMEKMEQSKSSNNIVDTDNATVTVSLDSGSENETMVCTYDIVWVWDSEHKYTESDVDLPYTKDDITYPYELSASVDGEEKDLSSLIWKNVNSKQEAVIANKEIKVYGKGSKTITHKIDVQVYNIPAIQQKLFNKNFKAHLVVKNNKCTGGVPQTIAEYIKKEVYVADGVNGLYYHDGIGTYTNAKLEAEDNSYRYAGSNPDNYVCFKEGCTDDEKYRIIGVFDNKVKVIKTRYVTELNSTSTWEGSSIEKYLNGEYLTQLRDNSNLIDSAVWHVGGMSNDIIVDPNTVKDAYKAELGSAPTLDRKVGLIYVSDYGYAAEPTYWSLTLANYSSSKGNNWMLLTSDRTWSISNARTYGGGDAFYIDSSGSIKASVNRGGSSAPEVNPVFSLKPSIKLVNGIGTSSNPYIIAF